MVARIEVVHPKVIVMSGAESEKILGKGKGTHDLKNPTPNKELPVVILHPDGESETEIWTGEKQTTFSTVYNAGGTSVLEDPFNCSTHNGLTKEIRSIGDELLAKVTHIDSPEQK